MPHIDRNHPHDLRPPAEPPLSPDVPSAALPIAVAQPAVPTAIQVVNRGRQCGSGQLSIPIPSRPVAVWLELMTHVDHGEIAAAAGQ